MTIPSHWVTKKTVVAAPGQQHQADPSAPSAPLRVPSLAEAPPWKALFPTASAFNTFHAQPGAWCFYNTSAKSYILASALVLHL